MLQRWRAAFEHAPWGQDWLQTGVIAAAVVNWSGHAKQARTAEEFVPGFKRTLHFMDAEAVERALTQAWGGVK